MFSNILVATDLGVASERALAIAVGLAREWGSGLELVHVVHDPRTEPWVAEGYGIDLGVIMTETRVHAEQALASRLAEIVPPLASMKGTVLVGRAAAEIVHHAQESGADLVVVGSHTRGGLGRALLGSVADRVAHTASCPVLIARAIAPAASVHHAA